MQGPINEERMRTLAVLFETAQLVSYTFIRQNKQISVRLRISFFFTNGSLKNLNNIKCSK